MARPKKIEGGATTQPVTTATSSAPNTTPAEGVSTAPEALVAEPTQLDDTTTVTPAESAVVETSLPLEGGTADPAESPVVPPSQREDGTNPAPVAAEATTQPEQVALVATSTPIPDGLGPKVVLGPGQSVDVQVAGRGGGKADVAQGGGTRPEGLNPGFAAAAEYVRGLAADAG